MVGKSLNMLLVLALLAGIALTIKANSRRAALRTEYNRLAAKVGRFEVQESDKLHLQRIETGDPHQLAWRCYQPSSAPSGFAIKGYQAGKRRGALNSAGHKEELRIYATLRLVDGRVKASCGVGDSGVAEDLGEEVSDFLKQHWSEIAFEPAAAKEKLVIAKGEPVKLAALRVPDSLIDAFTEQYGNEREDEIAKPLAFYFGDSSTTWP